MYKEKKYRTRINGKHTPMYIRFDNMMRRCYNPKHPRYSSYGGRGINVEPYLQIWTNFVDYMYTLIPKGQTIEAMQKLNMSLDRINNDGNYERGNLQWATSKQQQNNRKVFKNNSSGYQGVHWCKYTKKWRASIRAKNKNKHLGYFSSPEEGFDAYQKAYLKYHGPEVHVKMMERQQKYLEQR